MIPQGRVETRPFHATDEDDHDHDNEEEKEGENSH